MFDRPVAHVRRAFAIAALLVCAPSVGTAQPAGLLQPNTPPIATWDSLFANHSYFALLAAVRDWRGAETLEVRYYRGLLAHTFNKPDEAIGLLKPVVDSAPGALETGHRFPAYTALAESYLRIYRYREAANVYRRAIRNLRPLLDTATVSGLITSAAIAEAVGDALPQRVVWSRAARSDTLPNGGDRARVYARINGVPTARALQISIPAQFTLIDSTTAAAHHVRLLPARIKARSLTGAITTAQVGVISRLDLGPAAIYNVITLVFRDADLTLAQNAAHVTGIIGFPVINALGRIALTSDGHVALTAPGQPPLDTTVRARIALDQASSRPLTPVVEARYGSNALSFTLTFTAAPTSFSREFIATIAGRQLNDSGTTAGPLGPTLSESGDEIAIGVGGRSLHFPRAARTAEVNPENQFHAGSFGADALRQADAMTLDFVSMTAGFDQLPPPPVLPAITYPQQTTPVTETHDGPRELVFIGLLFALFIVPKALQRFRIPGAITSLIMGAFGGAFGSLSTDPTLHLLSTLGIVALFLFAGLEIDGRELRANASALLYHSALWGALATATAFVGALAFGASPRASTLLALALVTPSTGFILSSLTGFGLTTVEQRTVKTYAVGSELLALAVLFFALQSTSVEQLALAIAAMAGVVIFIPLAFRFFANVVAPYAPRSEFAFLLMVAVVCAYTTLRLGVYYLVGAFIVGVAAQRFRADHPAMSSEKMVDALESFGSVFIPFYFFHAGTQIAHDQLTLKALGIGVALAAVFVPLRIAVIGFHRRIALRESFGAARRIGSALIPTLVFTLVIVGILHDRFDLSNDLAGGLVLYTILNTLLPGFVLHGEPADFEDVVAASVGPQRSDR